MSGGVFGVDRGIWDHPIFHERKAFSRREAWLWLLSEAAWKPRRVRIPGSTFTLDRGQLAHSIRFMAKAWWWEQTRVVRFLEQLKNETMIATRLEAGHTVTSICNYNKYQVVGLPDATADATPTATPTQQDRNTNATNKKKEITEEGLDDGGRGASLISEKAYKVATELAAVCGFPSPDLWPSGWHGSPMWVQKCLNDGWFSEVMIAETRAVCQRKRDGPPDNYLYLEKPLARAHAKHQAPLPKVEIPKQETINGSNRVTQNRGGSVIDAAREMQRRLGGGTDNDDLLRISQG